jgi:carbamoylphosphate synthase small subunit
MALIETMQIPKIDSFNTDSFNTNSVRTVNEAVCALRGAMSAELNNSNMYTEIEAYLRLSGFVGIADRIKKILNDEIRHTGALMHCITELDSRIGAELQKGAEGA